ncbi:MAG TPA: hypothetical protein VM888_14515 [Chitinophagaceae bacterium]|nr:hypothetical protein [Chitinophagaceae bacterium]
MKKVVTFLVIAASLTACDEQSKTKTEIKIDSLGEKMDSLGQKVEAGAKKAWDSTKADAKELKEKIANKLDNIKDSARRKDTADRN